MTELSTTQSNMRGALCALAAGVCFSINDMVIKFLSDQYALHQVVFFRSIVGMLTFLLLIMPFSGGWSVMRTRMLRWHMVRGVCVVLANSTFFLGLAALNIADAVAIFFVSPLLIALMSIIFLSERVGPRRWAAIGVGFIGVLVIIQPGTSAFQVASVLPVLAALMYGTMHIVARRIGGTESAATMSFYIVVIFIVTSGLIGLTIGDGRFAGSSHPSLEFMFRAWAPLDMEDVPLFLLIGSTGVIGATLISQAYRISEAAFAAPFEYISLPLAIIWGITIFGTFPNVSGWIGMALILGAGLYLIWRETIKGRTVLPRPGRR